MVSSTLNINDCLDDELLFQILKRLPIKLVLRSKCVSKRWLNLISTVYFHTSYNRHRYLSAGSKPRFSLICNFPTDEQFNIRVNYFESFDSFAMDFIVAPPWLVSSSASIRVLASHHGLVLCSATSTESWTRYFICDILYKKWVPIPQAPTDAKHSRLGLLALAPSISVDDKNTDNMINSGFIIVRLPNDDRLAPTVEVYNSETGVWNESFHEYGTASTHDDDVESCAVAFNEMLVWRRSEDLLVFDPRRNGFTSIELEDKMKDSNNRNRYDYHRYKEKRIKPSLFGDSNGRLRCASYTKDTTLYCDIWELEGCDIYTGKWCLVQTIILRSEDLTWPRGMSSSEKPRVVPVAFHPLDEDVVFVGSAGSIISYNMKTKNSINIWAKHHNRYDDSRPLLFPAMLPWWPL